MRLGLGGAMAAKRRSAATYNSVLDVDSPFSHWKLNETSGTTATDRKGNANLTYTGTYILGTGGMQGSALELSGAGSATRASASTLVSQTAFSVEAWVRPDTAHGAAGGNVVAAIISKVDAAGANAQYGITVNDSVGQYTVYIRDSVGYKLLNAGSVVPNQWSYICMTWNGTTLTFYLNGVSAGSLASGSPISGRNAAGFWVGNEADIKFFDGLIDEVAYYNTALTGARVLAHYNALVPPSGGGSSSNPSGTAMPGDNKTGMQMVIAEDWDVVTPIGSWAGDGSGNSNYPVWDTFPNTWTDSVGDGRHAPELVISTTGSTLDYYLHTEGGFPRCGALLPAPTSTYSWLYGRWEVMMRADAAQKWKVAWLLWPLSESWPTDGEIDFPEGPLDATVEAYMHKQDAVTGTDQDGYISGTYFSDGAYHHCVIEWLPGFCRFTLDGVTLGATTNRVPNTAMNYRMQCETDTTTVPPDPAVSSHVQCDWFVAYKRATGAWNVPQADPDTFHYGGNPATSGNNFVLTMGAGDAQVGQLLIVPVVTKGTGVTVTPPAGWTQLGSAITQGGMRSWIFYRYHPGGAQTFTFTTTSATYREAMVIILSGTAASSPIDTSGVGQGTSATVTAPTVTATTYDLLVSVFTAGSTDTEFAQPAGMARLYPFSLTTGIKVAVEPVAPGATGTRAKTFAASGDRVAWNILVKGT